MQIKCFFYHFYVVIEWSLNKPYLGVKIVRDIVTIKKKLNIIWYEEECRRYNKNMREKVEEKV